MIAAHLLAAATWLLVAGLDRAGVAPRTIVLLSRAWLLAGIAALALPGLAPDTWQPVAAASWAPAVGHAVGGVAPAVVHAAAAPVATALRLGWIPWIGAFVGLLRLGRGLVALAGGLRTAIPLRRSGAARILVVPGLGSPAAAWLPGRPLVLLDPRTAADPVDSAIALRHEATHLRHGDAAWAWGWSLLEALLWPNPLAAALVRRVRVVEELACDEAVLRRVQPRIYADSLLRAAAAARPLPVGPLAAFPTALHRRLAVLTRPPSRAVPLIPAFLLGLVALVGTAALAGPGLPDAVGRDALDQITASAKARAWYHRGVENRAPWSPLVDGALAAAGMPAWLAAVPLVESGYTNLGAPDDPAYGPGGSRAPGTIPGRGLWMFIPATARTYGLRVDDTLDQRFDPALETAAAIALLGDLHDRFGDWDLALAAYNQGPDAVQSAIDAGGTRDVAALVEAGLLNDYVPQVHAAAAILAHPELVE